eukprot:TRINITY_DN4499_c0_g1_i6.p1 TRINITY_DN4499_c0_g1~~TRINITY_DN4499_c0_g1_i6.p1  ORF type:complete len:101 (+),score=6.73 TRINITY_DN4499_c0_g1_i6:1161-1463(+)
MESFHLLFHHYQLVFRNVIKIGTFTWLAFAIGGTEILLGQACSRSISSFFWTSCGDFNDLGWGSGVSVDLHHFLLLYWEMSFDKTKGKDKVNKIDGGAYF